MEFSYTESTDTSTNMVTKDYSKSRMRENCKYGSVRGGQSNLIPSTRLCLPLAGGFRGEGIAFGDEYKDSVTGFPARHGHSEPQAKNLGTRSIRDKWH